MQSLSLSSRNIRAYPRSKKKICIDQWLGKHYWILRRIQAKGGIGEQVRFDPNTIWEVWGAVQPQENFAIFTLIYTDTKLL